MKGLKPGISKNDFIIKNISGEPPTCLNLQCMCTCTVLPRCYSPPPIFGRNCCIGLFYLHYTPTPPPPARAGLRYCTCLRVTSAEELYSCIKRVENSLRTGLGLVTDLGRFPEASDSASHPAVSLEGGGRSLAVRLHLLCFAAIYTWRTTLPSFSTATACRSKEFSDFTTQLSFVDLSTRICGSGGRLNCEVKAQVLVVTPPSSFSWK